MTIKIICDFEHMYTDAIFCYHIPKLTDAGSIFEIDLATSELL